MSKKKLSAKSIFTKGVWSENPVLKMLLGMCPTLAVTTSAENGLGMGLASLVVLTMSNIAISLLRNVIPQKLRIPAFIVVIATFVTIVDMVLHAYVPGLHKALGIFIPLIVVNCVILGRAEAFASKNNILYSALDGFSMGLGFALSLTMLGSIREIFGNGTIFGAALMPGSFSPIIIMILPPGAFITLGLMLASVNYLNERKV